MSFAILRTAKLKSSGEIGGSLAHNYRTRFTANADQSKTHLNEHECTLEQVKQNIENRLPEKIRKNGVRVIEYLITASQTWEGWSTEKETEFFDQAKKWLIEKHGSENVAGLSIHRDETTPHLVAYIVPIDGKGALNARHFLGGRQKLSQMQTDFANSVNHLNLERGIQNSKAEHVPIQKFYEKVNNSNDYDIQENIPKKGFFENEKKYAQKVIESALPEYEKNRVLATETLDLKKQNQRLKNQIEKAEVYFDCVQDLNKKNLQTFNSLILEESNKLLSMQKKLEAEKLAKQKREEAKKRARLQAEKELLDEKINELTNTFQRFENTYESEFNEREVIQKELNNRLKKTQKWIKKHKLTIDDLERLDALWRPLIERPDFYIDEYEYEVKYNNADLKFQNNVSKAASNLNIFTVVRELKSIHADDQKYCNELDDFESIVTPIYDAYCDDRRKKLDMYYEDQRRNERDRKYAEEERKRNEEYQNQVNERISRRREFERQNIDYSPPSRKKNENDNDFSM